MLRRRDSFDVSRLLKHAGAIHQTAILSNEPLVTRVLMHQMDRVAFRVSARCADPGVFQSSTEHQAATAGC